MLMQVILGFEESKRVTVSVMSLVLCFTLNRELLSSKAKKLLPLTV